MTLSLLGGTGPATLFAHAWNITHGELGRREMTTGLHIVRDVFCSVCKKKLGWMYEMALVKSQEYKEGQVILENANMIKISNEIRDPIGEQYGSARLQRLQNYTFQSHSTGVTEYRSDATSPNVF
uniref:Protein yippee-like n=1 Tax=Caenorhabditis tropicalis TaxID=1561998 RepID=A0A1I7UH07_9PELO